MLLTDTDIRYYIWPDHRTRFTGLCFSAAYAVKHGRVYPYYSYTPGAVWGTRVKPTQSVAFFNEDDLRHAHYVQVSKAQMDERMAGVATPLPELARQHLETM